MQFQNTHTKMDFVYVQLLEELKKQNAGGAEIHLHDVSLLPSSNLIPSFSSIITISFHSMLLIILAKCLW